MYRMTVKDITEGFVYDELEGKDSYGMSGRLYELCRKLLYNSKEVSTKVKELYTDEFITSNKGIFEYVLGGCIDTKLLQVRIFNDKDKKIVYAKQTEKEKVFQIVL